MVERSGPLVGGRKDGDERSVLSGNAEDHLDLAVEAASRAVRDGRTLRGDKAQVAAFSLDLAGGSLHVVAQSTLRIVESG